MNDFTKKELEYFLACMKPFHFLWQDDPLELETKLQSMIDNYCEHIWTDGSGNMIFCAKCNIHGGRR